MKSNLFLIRDRNRIQAKRSASALRFHNLHFVYTNFYIKVPCPLRLLAETWKKWYNKITATGGAVSG